MAEVDLVGHSSWSDRMVSLCPGCNHRPFLPLVPGGPPDIERGPGVRVKGGMENFFTILGGLGGRDCFGPNLRT